MVVTNLNLGKVKFLYTTIFLIINTSAFSADNYPKYYNLANEAKELYKQKEFVKATDKINTAFSYVSYIHNEKLLLASEIAAALDQYESVSKYLFQAFSQGVSIDDITSNAVYIDYVKSSYFRELEKKYNKLHAQYVDGLNVEYASKIEILYSTHQQSMNELKTFKTDSTIFFSFMSLVKTYGFPTERMVKKRTLLNAYALISNLVVKVPQNHIYLNQLKEFLMEGKYMPFYYAYAFDRSLVIRNENPVYYCGVKYDASKLKEDDYQRINTSRLEIGLKPLIAKN